MPYQSQTFTKFIFGIGEFGTLFASRAYAVLLVASRTLDSPPSKDYSDKYFVKQFTSSLKP